MDKFIYHEVPKKEKKIIEKIDGNYIYEDKVINTDLVDEFIHKLVRNKLNLIRKNAYKDNLKNNLVEIYDGDEVIKIYCCNMMIQKFVDKFFRDIENDD